MQSKTAEYISLLNTGLVRFLVVKGRSAYDNMISGYVSLHNKKTNCCWRLEEELDS